MSGLFCKYKDVFGHPGTGIHGVRIFDIAVVDLGFTIAFAVFLWWALSYKYSLWVICVCMFILGIIMHRAFCVNTTVNKWIFGVV